MKVRVSVRIRVGGRVRVRWVGLGWWVVRVGVRG